MEAVAIRLALVADRLDPGRAARLAAGGGAWRNWASWRRMVADVMERPVYQSLAPEVSSRGAALMALEALGALDALERAPDFLGRPVMPRPERFAACREARARHEELYRRMLGPLT